MAFIDCTAGPEDKSIGKEVKRSGQSVHYSDKWPRSRRRAIAPQFSASTWQPLGWNSDRAPESARGRTTPALHNGFRFTVKPVFPSSFVRSKEFRCFCPSLPLNLAHNTDPSSLCRSQATVLARTQPAIPLNRYGGDAGEVLTLFDELLELVFHGSSKAGDPFGRARLVNC